MEEAVSGVKGELAIKIYGDDLATLEEQGRRDRRRHAHSSAASQDLGLFRVLGQPNLNLTVDREPRPPAIRSTSPTCRTPFRPPSAATPSPRCCRASSATTWSCAICRNTATPRKPIENIRLLVALRRARLAGASSAPSRSRTAPPKSIAKATQRYVAIKYGVRGRDLGQHRRGGDAKVDRQGETARRAIASTGPANTPASSARSGGWRSIIPLTLLVIFMILYSMFGSMKWAGLILVTVAMAPVGGIAGAVT